MAATEQITVHDRLFINGCWSAPATADTIDVMNPATERVIARVPAGNAEDVARAVAAARAAFESWAATSVDERAAMLDSISATLQERADEVAALISAELGMPLGPSKAVQAALPVATFADTARRLREQPLEERVGHSVVVREPIGVVGAITPWNFPLHQIAAKVAPALAAGCTVVLKPSELAPLDAFLLAEICEACEAPPGVFNLVTGTGAAAGEALAAHPEVDMVSFTGSTRAGRRVSELAAETVKKVALELGGKSPNVILDDADLEAAVAKGVADCCFNTGQKCSALTRMLVPRERLAEAEQIAKREAESVSPGDPLDPSTHIGPLVSGVQLERVRAYIEKGIQEGARLVTGGAEPPDGLESGYYVRPTVFSDVSNDMTIAREEIFGPVLSIIPYEDEEEAIRLANDSMYGLAAAVWAGDQERAWRVAKRLRAGQIEVNGGEYNPLAPFGGFKRSGHGRECGHWGLGEFQTVKAIALPAA